MAPIAVGVVPVVTKVSGSYLGAAARVVTIGAVPGPPRVTWTVPGKVSFGTYSGGGGRTVCTAVIVTINGGFRGPSSTFVGLRPAASDAVTGSGGGCFVILLFWLVREGGGWGILFLAGIGVIVSFWCNSVFLTGCPGGGRCILGGFFTGLQINFSGTGSGTILQCIFMVGGGIPLGFYGVLLPFFCRSCSFPTVVYEGFRNRYLECGVG